MADASDTLPSAAWIPTIATTHLLARGGTPRLIVLTDGILSQLDGWAAEIAERKAIRDAK